MPLPRILRRLLWVWGAFLGLLIVLLVVGLFQPQVLAPEPITGTGSSIVLIRPDGVPLRLEIEVADAPDEWRRGLMNRPVVTRGMLFAFPDEEVRGFWMKDTLVPLDIAFFRADGTWVSSTRMAPCLVESCPNYSSGGPAGFALELPAGEIDPGIGTGWKLSVGD